MRISRRTRLLAGWLPASAAVLPQRLSLHLPLSTPKIDQHPGLIPQLEGGPKPRCEKWRRPAFSSLLGWGLGGRSGHFSG